MTSKAVRTVSKVLVCLFVLATLWRLRLNSFHFPSQSVFHAHGSTTNVDWSRFAYTQYVTNTAYLCNSVMLFETLHRLGSRADRLIMYPAEFSTENDSVEGKLLRKARDEYGVKLAPIEIQSRDSADSTWAESYTKLLAFNQTQYQRVLSLDSDATLLQSMDELFLLPPCPVAVPRAYWLNPNDRTMSSQVVLIQPSEFEFNRIKQSIADAGSNDYDMEIVNNLYKDSALILPHRPYDLLTGEFRSKNHTSYLGNAIERWDPMDVLSEAKFLHFSDWPVPKPWVRADPKLIEEKQPTCDINPETGLYDDCRARDIWLGVYDDFAQRRQVL
ncbi:nucleotide-diphospho-sugar transferase [Aspergillus saccharolyticus JOP 1030-1]|uniref:Nucleotide-diphospho-sugar transferase n=1 Tax=Aspergillus saccharolyticus JOP 1030-1 TaxID=1450539 RepID=A0A318ZLS1_9EURO|nr:nucleotide-diphospho-sugar transferase [Aspergillus saccharolyticus JOP 1030-1]PYH44750.1 nucleotide-diphospho-sugar transferase [Aspergillus saccharolyticus JOP 1030-1]